MYTRILLERNIEISLLDVHVLHVQFLATCVHTYICNSVYVYW